jgi:hypothetical protein
MKQSLIALTLSTCLLLPAGAAFGANPHTGGTTGQPNKSCQDLGLPTPGNAAASPGSPFNEPAGTSLGGRAGQVYAGNRPGAPSTANSHAVSQYDVACFQHSQMP